METWLQLGERKIKISHPKGTTMKVSGKTLVAEPQRPEIVRLQEAAASEGIPWGDMVKWATDRAGIRQCPSCKQAQTVLNQVHQIGWAAALREIARIKLGR